MAVINKRYQDPKINNKHGTHLATCLCCINMQADAGSPGYSDETPGQEPSTRCEAGVLNLDSTYGDYTDVLHSAARHCTQFQPRTPTRGEN